MQKKKLHTIARLQKEILPLQGFKTPANNARINFGLGSMEQAFPNAVFPLGAVHEFICDTPENAASTGGFIASLLTALMSNKGVSVWISSSRTLFPPALKAFGISPDRVIFIDLHKEKDILWVMEEALKCTGLAAVVGELQEISFTASRRLQLAVEQSRVTGFIVRNNPRNLSTVACISRWKITPLPTALEDDMPGIGFPRWNVALQKIRNGRPGVWQIEWVAQRFRFILPFTESVYTEQKRRAG